MFLAGVLVFCDAGAVAAAGLITTIAMLFTVGFFFVMLAPTGTPESVRAMLEREVQAALKSPDFQVRLRAQDLEALATTGSEAMARLKSTAARWADVVKAANITAD